MLEVRFNTDTKKVTAWCGDETQFGNVEREGDTVVILDIPIPDKPIEAWLYDEATQALIVNPDYVESKPESFDPRAEINALKSRVDKLERK